MRKDYAQTFDIPIIYEHLPPEVVITGDLPESMQITISAKGSAMFKYSYGKGFTPLVIDVSKGKKEKNIYTIPSEYIKTEIRRQLQKETFLLGFTPDNIRIYYALEESKQVPVRINANILPGTQRMLSGKPEVNPTMVTVYAPQSILDTLTSVSTVFFEEKGIQDTLRKKVFLKKINGVKTAPSKVDILIPIEEFTEKTIEIPVYNSNVPGNLIMRTFPSKVKISFFVVLSKFNDVTDSDFQVVANYTDIKKDENNGKLKINLSKFPDMIDNIRLNVTEVDVLLEEKAMK